MSRNPGGNTDKHLKVGDPTSPDWVPRITCLENPFDTILQTVNDSLESKTYWEGIEDALRSCLAIVEIQTDCSSFKNNPPIITKEIALQRFESKNPVLSKEDFLVFSSDFTPIAGKVLPALGVDDEVVKSALKESNPDLLELFIEDAKDLHERMKNIKNLDEDLFLLALNSAYQIFAVHEGAKVSPWFEQEIWQKAFCPICGTGPEMGRITAQNGHYYLSCALCFTEWKYPRIGCPFCGNTEHKELAHFQAEEYSQYRVNVCRKCNSYIKVSLEEKLGRRHIPVFDTIFTLELDSLAQSEGFHHGEISFFDEFSDPVSAEGSN